MQVNACQNLKIGTLPAASVVDAGAVPFVHTTSQYEKLGVIVVVCWTTCCQRMRQRLVQ